MKVTFKRMHHTGRYRSFALGYTDVKVKRRKIGTITERRQDGLWRCSIMIKSDVPSSGWRWVTLKGAHKTEQAARDFFTLRIDEIYAKFAVHEQED